MFIITRLRIFKRSYFKKKQRMHIIYKIAHSIHSKLVIIFWSGDKSSSRFPLFNRIYKTMKLHKNSQSSNTRSSTSIAGTEKEGTPCNIKDTTPIDHLTGVNRNYLSAPRTRNKSETTCIFKASVCLFVSVPTKINRHRKVPRQMNDSFLISTPGLERVGGRIPPPAGRSRREI